MVVKIGMKERWAMVNVLKIMAAWHMWHVPIFASLEKDRILDMTYVLEAYFSISISYKFSISTLPQFYKFSLLRCSTGLRSNKRKCLYEMQN